MLTTLSFLCGIALAVFTPTVRANCGEGDYDHFLDCLHNAIAGEWTKLASQQDLKIQTDEGRYQQCFGDNCGGTLNFNQDWAPLLEDQSLVNLANKIRKFWDSASRGMQQCILRDARNKFFDELQNCVRAKGPDDFSLHTPYRRDLPMPSLDMYNNNRQLLIKAVADILTVLISAKDCPHDSRMAMVRCMKEPTDNDLRGCVQQNLCTVPDCANVFGQVCSSVSQCIPEILANAGAKLSKLQGDKKSDILVFMGDCEKEGQIENPDYHFSRSDMLSIYQALVHVANDGLGDKFKALLTDMVTAYFDGSSFCANTCGGGNRFWLRRK